MFLHVCDVLFNNSKISAKIVILCFHFSVFMKKNAYIYIYINVLQFAREKWGRRETIRGYIGLHFSVYIEKMTTFANWPEGFQRP